MHMVNSGVALLCMWIHVGLQATCILLCVTQFAIIMYVVYQSRYVLCTQDNTC